MAEGAQSQASLRHAKVKGGDDPSSRRLYQAILRVKEAVSFEYLPHPSPHPPPTTTCTHNHA
ncbi:MAG: hypothetical protein MJE68_18450 [Proteobacteria bacterium]|nr:hypothetical protein [Pseudomonadota bacterium]